jgi:putative colanic acid biosynthesis acetyltransferase WcaF
MAVGEQKKTIPQLRDFNNTPFSRGRSIFVELIWIALSWVFVQSHIPGSTHRRFLLKLFGAGIGSDVIIKPGVRVKFPWRLSIGDNSWIGEDVWIDNLGDVEIGDNCCISQGAYFCTGDHDWSRVAFDLKVGKIRIEDGAWVAAKSILGPNVVVGTGAVLTIGSVATTCLEPWGVYKGNPAVAVSKRKLDSA